MARNESKTVTNHERTYTVTRLSPAGVADAQQVAYTVPRNDTADRVVVYGHLLPAEFLIEGWLHRVTMTLDADMRPSRDHGVYVSQLTIDVTDDGFASDGAPRLTESHDLRGMPLGVWLDAAAKLCAFRGTARPVRIAVGGRTVHAHGFQVTTPRAAAKGRDALAIEVVGLAAHTPARLVKTRTGRRSMRNAPPTWIRTDSVPVALPPWKSREALREVARLWRLQDADPTVRGRIGLAAWLASQTGRPANTCSMQLSEARRAGLLPAYERRKAVKHNTNTKRGKR